MKIHGHLEHREDSGVPPQKYQRMARTHWKHLLLPTNPTTHQRHHEEEERDKPCRKKPPESWQKLERQATEFAYKEQNPVSRDERDDPECFQKVVQA
jgi:hypothetical protein